VNNERPVGLIFMCFFFAISGVLLPVSAVFHFLTSATWTMKPQVFISGHVTKAIEFSTMELSIYELLIGLPVLIALYGL
jgi:hypothetical protein